MKKIYGENTLVPVGDTASSFKGIIKVNHIGSFIWNNLESAENEKEIAFMVANKYNLELEKAISSVNDFVKYLKDVKII